MTNSSTTCPPRTPPPPRPHRERRVAPGALDVLASAAISTSSLVVATQPPSAALNLRHAAQAPHPYALSAAPKGDFQVALLQDYVHNLIDHIRPAIAPDPPIQAEPTSGADPPQKLSRSEQRETRPKQPKALEDLRGFAREAFSGYPASCISGVVQAGFQTVPILKTSLNIVAQQNPEVAQSVARFMTREKGVKAREKRHRDCLAYLDHTWGSREAWWPPEFRGGKSGDGVELQIASNMAKLTKIALAAEMDLGSLWNNPGGAVYEACSKFANPPCLNRDASIIAVNLVKSAAPAEQLTISPSEVAQHETASQGATVGDEIEPPSPDPELGRDASDIGLEEPAEARQPSPSPSGMSLAQADSGSGPFLVDDDTLGALLPLDLGNQNAPDQGREADIGSADDSFAVVDVVSSLSSSPSQSPHRDPQDRARSVKQAVPGLADTTARLNDLSMAHISQLLVAEDRAKARAGGYQVRYVVLDPLWLEIDGDALPGRLPKSVTEQSEVGLDVLLMLHHRQPFQHWTVARLRLGTSSVSIEHYDSCPSIETQAKLRTRLTPWLTQLLPGKEIVLREMPCPRQPDATSCGIMALEVLRRLISGIPIPEKLGLSVVELRGSFLELCQRHGGLESGSKVADAEGIISNGDARAANDQESSDKAQPAVEHEEASRKRKRESDSETKGARSPTGGNLSQQHARLSHAPTPQHQQVQSGDVRGVDPSKGVGTEGEASIMTSLTTIKASLHKAMQSAAADNSSIPRDAEAASQRLRTLRDELRRSRDEVQQLATTQQTLRALLAQGQLDSDNADKRFSSALASAEDAARTAPAVLAETMRAAVQRAAAEVAKHEATTKSVQDDILARLERLAQEAATRTAQLEQREACMVEWAALWDVCASVNHRHSEHS